MSPEGVLEDRNRPPVDVTDEQVVTWYKNMLSGMLPQAVRSSIIFLG